MISMNHSYHNKDNSNNREKESDFNINSQTNSEIFTETDIINGNFCYYDSSESNTSKQSYYDEEQQEAFLNTEMVMQRITGNRNKKIEGQKSITVPKKMLQRKRNLPKDPNNYIYDDAKTKTFCTDFEGLNKQFENFVNDISQQNMSNISKDNVQQENKQINAQSNDDLKTNDMEYNKYSSKYNKINNIETEKKIIQEINKDNNCNAKFVSKNNQDNSSCLIIHEDMIEYITNLNDIILYDNLSVDQKEYINKVISRIRKIDINQMAKSKLTNGKNDKLELIFDLENTCIYTYEINEDLMINTNIRDYLDKSNIKFASFNDNNNKKNIGLIIRNGLKEFLEFVSPLCNFYINTLSNKAYSKAVKNILEKSINISFIEVGNKEKDKLNSQSLHDLKIEKENAIIFDDDIRSWKNNDNDHHQVIISKYFLDDEFLNLCNSKKEKVNNKIESIHDQRKINDKIKSFDDFCYMTIINNTNKKVIEDEDWKKQRIKEYSSIPFYLIYKNNDNEDDIDCLTAEYNDSTKFQFNYMKDVIKIIYYLKFIFGIEIGLCIKLLRISILNNMIFYIKYLPDIEINIITDMVKTCGGDIFDSNNTNSNNINQIVYVVTNYNYYQNNKAKIDKDLGNCDNYVLLDESFIIDSYYFMTDIRHKIYDIEYIITR